MFNYLNILKVHHLRILYLNKSKLTNKQFKARGPSGAASRKARSGKGAVLKAEFSLNKGEVIQLLIGKKLFMISVSVLHLNFF